jgi:hypothetical protein
MVLLVVGCVMPLMARQMEHGCNWKCKGNGSGDMWRVDANSIILGREVKEGAGVSW